MKAWMTSTAIVLAMCMGASALAGDGCGAKAKDGEKATAGKGCAATCKDKAGMAAKCGDKAKGDCGDMPKVMYKVADKSFCCEKEATQVAKETEGAKVLYVVAGKEYADKAEAMTAYRDQLETFLGNVTTVRYAVGDDVVSCPSAAADMAKDKKADMTFRVASYKFDKKDAAEKAARAAAEAADNVSLKMVVDGKTITCDKAAEKACGTTKASLPEGACKHAQAADTAAKKPTQATQDCEYMISTDENTKIHCPIMARVELAKARIAAAMKALESATGQNVAGGA